MGIGKHSLTIERVSGLSCILLLATRASFGADTARSKVAQELTFEYEVHDTSQAIPPKTPSPNEPSFMAEGHKMDVTCRVDIKRTPSLTVVTGEYPSFSNKNGGKAIPQSLAFGKDWAAVVTYGVVNSKKVIYHAVISGCKPDQESLPNAVDFSMTFRPHLLYFLAGTDASVLYGVRWRESAAGADALLGASNADELGNPIVNGFMNFPVDMEIRMRRHDGYPKELMIRDRGALYGKEKPVVVSGIQARGGISYAGMSWPQEVYEIGDLRIAKVAKVWTLKSVSKTKKLDIPIDVGAPVADYRLDVHELDVSTFPPPNVQPVSYRWDGHLPSLDELRKMRDADKQDNKRAPERSLLASIVPFAVLLVSSGYLLFARKKKVAP